MGKKEVIDFGELYKCVTGKNKEIPGKILGFVTVMLGEDGGVMVNVIANVPAGLEGYEMPDLKVLLAAQLLMKVLQGVVSRKSIANEVEQKQALDAARGISPPATLVYAFTSGELMLIPSGSDVEMMKNPKGEA